MSPERKQETNELGRKYKGEIADNVLLPKFLGTYMADFLIAFRQEIGRVFKDFARSGNHLELYDDTIESLSQIMAELSILFADLQTEIKKASENIGSLASFGGTYPPDSPFGKLSDKPIDPTLIISGVKIPVSACYQARRLVRKLRFIIDTQLPRTENTLIRKIEPIDILSATFSEAVKQSTTRGMK